MAADNLTAPLGLSETPGIRRRGRFPYGLIGLGLFVAMAATIIVWLSLVDDPHGGEPIATADLTPTATGVTPSDVEVVSIRGQTADTDSAAGGADRDTTAGGDGGSLITAVEPPQTAPQPVTSGDASGPLSTATVPKITEKGRDGPLPKAAADGSRPFDLYSAPIPAHLRNAPQIAIVVADLGLSQTGTQQAIRTLPKEVTLAFAPYGGSLDRWMRHARTGGHELLLQVPLEPFDFPDNDPGPHTLLTSLPNEENMRRLHWVMSRLTNYVGIVNYMGARFTADGGSLAAFLDELGRRGLMYLDNGTSPRSRAESVAHATRTPFAKSEVVIDASDIDTRLLELETIARSKGSAVGYASALPVTVKRIAEWAKSLESRGVVLVPISAIVRKRQG